MRVVAKHESTIGWLMALTNSIEQTVSESTHFFSLLPHHNRRRRVRILEYALCLIDPNLLMLVERLLDAFLE